ncbi:MAG: hypothetical protein M3Q42_14095 [Pseudomonadota bacterium]|nr:hypothetical protein [Pseudomonadota bacterium]
MNVAAEQSRTMAAQLHKTITPTLRPSGGSLETAELELGLGLHAPPPGVIGMADGTKENHEYFRHP